MLSEKIYGTVLLKTEFVMPTKWVSTSGWSWKVCICKSTLTQKKFPNQTFIINLSWSAVLKENL